MRPNANHKKKTFSMQVSYDLILNEYGRKFSVCSFSRSQTLSKKTNEELDEERSKWIPECFSKNLEYLEMRESSLTPNDGFSFANIFHCNTITASPVINRKVVFELIYQYLQSIGFYKTAEILTQETGIHFQSLPQPWERSDLHLLVSLGISHRENVWDIPIETNHQNFIEFREEDYSSSSYREDPTTIWDEYFNPDLNAIYDSDQKKCYQSLVACSLKRLIVYLCTSNLHEVNDEEQHIFFLTIHSITSSKHFLEHLVTLFECKTGNHEKISPVKALNLRLNVINLLKKWMFYHGLFIGRNTLNCAIKFLNRVFNDPEHLSLKPYIETIINTLIGLEYGMKKGSAEKVGEPVIPNPQILFEPKITLLDPEPIEVARQITLIFHKMYASIHSSEFIIALKLRKTSIHTPTIKEFFSFREHITRLFAECYLNSNNKEYAYFRIFDIIKNLNDLYNFDAVSCLSQLMLRRDIRSFIHKTQQMKEAKKQLLSFWKRTGENDKNEKQLPTQYDQAISSKFCEWCPCIPNIHVELKRMSKEVLKLPDFIIGLINWKKMHYIAKRCTTLYRFQNITYNFWEIPQIQKILLRNDNLDQNQLRFLGLQKSCL